MEGIEKRNFNHDVKIKFVNSLYNSNINIDIELHVYSRAVLQKISHFTSQE